MLAFALLLLCLGTFGAVVDGEIPHASSTQLAAITPRSRGLGFYTVNSTGSESINGCECISECDVSFDSLIPWCLTSQPGVPRDEVVDPCGRFSSRRSAFWDECIVNVTSSDHLAVTFEEQFNLMVLTCTSTTMSVFFLVSMRSIFSMCSVIRKVWWMPALFVAWGGLLSAVFSSIASMFLAQVYLSMPYAIPRSFAIALGAGQAAVVIYWQFARSFNPHTA